MKKHLLLSFSFVLLSFFTFGQASIEGKILDEELNEGLIGAEVTLYKNDVFITGTATDFDGNYALTGLEAGTYDIEAKYTGYQSVRETGVVLFNGQTNRVNVKLSEGVMIDVVEIKAYKAPLIQQDNTTQGKTVTADQIRSLPTKSIGAIAATSAGLSTTDGSDDISVRGSRSDATNIYVDGIRVSASSIPASEIDQLQVITGGMEAKYGDVTGGIISITSKGPSDNFTGGAEVETSLDGFGYNLLMGYISGPLLKKKSDIEGGKDKSILGFRFSGQYRSVDDNRPSAVGVYRMPAERISELEANPIGFIGNTPVPRAEFLGDEDIAGILSTRPNENRSDVNITGKIDARITDNIDVSVSGGYEQFKDQFTPGDGWALLNWTNNPFEYGEGFRTSFRLRHKIGKQGLGEDEDSEGSSGLIRNAYYSLQAGFERRKTREEDLRHEDRLFDYGYYGNQEVTWNPLATIVTDPTNWFGEGIQQDIIGNTWDHQGDIQVNGEFTPSDINGAVSSYNQRNGFTQNPLDDVFNGLHQNVGQVYNRFEKSESDRYTANIALGFDLLPGGSKQGRHSIQMGFNYEYRIDRFYVAAPERLWELARLNANRHIIGVDTTQMIGTFNQDIPGFPDTEFIQYGNLLEIDNDASFYRKVRESQGVAIDQYINTDGIDPSEMRLDFFSAGELNNFGLLNYYGYDYLGNKLSASTTFDDFFTSRDDDGIRTFDVAPLKPIYWSAYLQDKFSYKDIIFRLGVRLDYYDANTKVLKTPHALYDIETASEFYSRTGQEQPESIGDDYEVYVTDEESDDIKGFRLGDQFFLPNGTAVANGAVLFSDVGNVVFPSYVGRFDNTVLDIQAPFDPDTPESERYNVSTSFEDFTPTINVMPRLAFSFPISEDANFFAHYDILVQRPPTGTAATARSYYYFGNRDRTPLDNPNLKPEQTIDYEVGFQQKLTNSSAIKVSAYYKELRNMIQRRQFLFIPAPNFNYEAFGNLDFGTVKGFAFQYDLRRTKNIELTASYTLQFADGTGSDANSSNGLNTRGNIRTLLPLTYDERHRLAIVADYRYGSGTSYNGPQIAGMDVFADAGINLLVTTVSGRPYSRFTTPQSINNGQGAGFLGSINGARLPWTFNVDFRIDKRIAIGLGGEGKRKLNANVFLRATNLLNTRNILGVFPVTSDPEDDGFLVSSFGQDAVDGIINSGKDLDNYFASYQARVLDPGNFTLPRRIFVGVIFDF